jgi:autotransporter-associated beta strand protein
MNRLGLRGRSATHQNFRNTRLHIESLEERRLLTAYNLLASTFFDSSGSSVVRYNENTHLLIPGGVATGAAAAQTGTTGLGQASGLAVAPDGTYYVSSLATGEVLHFSNTGAFLNVLGAGDTNPAPLYAPGTLAFGPNGNLYVAEFPVPDPTPTNPYNVLPSAIFQFDTTSATQQYQSEDTVWLPYVGTSPNIAPFVPGGFTFAPDAGHELIVGDLQSGEVAEFNSNGAAQSPPLIAPGSGLDPSAILALTNGNLLIADTDYDNVTSAHHQVVDYNIASGTTTQFYDLSHLQVAGQNPPQPTSLMVDTDGNLLVGYSPDDFDDGVIEKFSMQTSATTGDVTGTPLAAVATGIGDPSGLGLVPTMQSDLLASTFFDSSGSSVVRYNETTHLPIPGGVATGAAATQTQTTGLGQASGMAVAPDGTYYVSSLATGEVLHFSNTGAFLNVLGANDTNPAPMYAPGTLAFGPNGNLYVAEFPVPDPTPTNPYNVIPSAIFQFDTSSSTQQYQSADTVWLPNVGTAPNVAPFVPGGFTFAPDSGHELIVGDLQSGEVVEFDSNGAAQSPPLIAPGSGLDPAAILALPSGNLLIADTDYDNVTSSHHQIADYNIASNTTTQFYDLSHLQVTGQNPPQPTSLTIDLDGNLLVGYSPDDFDHAVIEKFSMQTSATTGDVTGTPIAAVATGIGDPSGLGLVPTMQSDLLASTFFDSNSSSVVRYSESTHLLIPGGVATGAAATETGTTGLGQASGLAVAPDGTYYVSSLATGEVLHFSNTGAFLNVLGASDTNPAPMYAPGTLAFGPNGNLYVAEFPVPDPTPTNPYNVIPSAIFQFDTSSSTQQYQSADTVWLPNVGTAPNVAPFVPGGFTFAPDSGHELIVGDLQSGEVVEFDSNGAAQSPPLIAPGSGLDPAAILALPSGNLLIADTDYDNVTSSHHQIADYNIASKTTTQFYDLSHLQVTGQNPPQPTSLTIDLDGNLLVGYSPDDFDHAVIEKFSMQTSATTGDVTGTPIAAVATGIGDPSGLGLVRSQTSVPPVAVPASDWTSSGLTVTRTSDQWLQVFQTGTPSKIFAQQEADSVGQIQVTGPDNATNNLTLDFSGGNPIPLYGIAFIGGAGSAMNSITISGASYLSGTIQTTGSVTLGQGDPSNEMFEVESGTINANLTGSGGLSKTGNGKVTLSGTDSYLGGTVVTGGTLNVTSFQALAAGSMLTVGAGATTLFGAAVAAPASAAIASTSAAESSAASSGLGSSSSAAEVAVVAPVAASPSTAACDLVLRAYAPAASPAIAPATAGAVPWWNTAAQSSNSESSSAGSAQIAALDDLMSQYGKS